MMDSYSQVDLQPIAGSHEGEVSAFSNYPKMHCRCCSSMITTSRKIRRWSDVPIISISISICDNKVLHFLTIQRCTLFLDDRYIKEDGDDPKKDGDSDIFETKYFDLRQYSSSFSNYPKMHCRCCSSIIGGTSRKMEMIQKRMEIQIFLRQN